MPARLVNLADVVEVYHRTGGVEAAVAVARERSGTQFDPELVEIVLPSGAGPVRRSRRADHLAGGHRRRADARRSCCPTRSSSRRWTRSPTSPTSSRRGPLGHSRGVADLAGLRRRGSSGLSESDARLVRRAGLVHDLGRLGVSNAIWDKRGAAHARRSVERVRMHPYLTERMLASSDALAPLAAIAVQHHERLDGSGYPRGLSGDALTPEGRDPRRRGRLPRHDRAAAPPRRRSPPRTPRPSCAPASAQGALRRRRGRCGAARGGPPRSGGGGSGRAA